MEMRKKAKAPKIRKELSNLQQSIATSKWLNKTKESLSQENQKEKYELNANQDNKSLKELLDEREALSI